MTANAHRHLRRRGPAPARCVRSSGQSSPRLSGDPTRAGRSGPALRAVTCPGSRGRRAGLRPQFVRAAGASHCAHLPLGAVDEMLPRGSVSHTETLALPPAECQQVGQVLWGVGGEGCGLIPEVYSLCAAPESMTGGR